MTDPRDIATSRRALTAQVKLHASGGARRIQVLAEGLPTWRLGDDLEAFTDKTARIHLRAGGARLFSAHQMGTCRMGTDPGAASADEADDSPANQEQPDDQQQDHGKATAVGFDELTDAQQYPLGPPRSDSGKCQW